MLLGVAGTGGPRGDGAGETQERAFPIHHIPPTDCPYETDTFFFTIRSGALPEDPGTARRLVAAPIFAGGEIADYIIAWDKYQVRQFLFTQICFMEDGYH